MGKSVAKYGFREHIGFLQGAYFLVTGVWPLLHIESFITVSGPKTDLWLVKTVGSLITVIAIVILTASFKKNISSEIMLLGIGSALTLAFIDVYYALNDTVSKAYLWDALAESIIIIFWVIAWRKR